MAGTAKFINGILGSPDTPATFPVARFDDTITRGDFDANIIRNCGSAGALEFNILGTHYVTNCTFTGNTLDLLFTQPSGTVTLNMVNSTSSPTTPTTSNSIAWQVNEITEHDVNVKETDGTDIQNATVYAESTSAVEEFNVLTDVNGDIVQQDAIRRDIEHTSGLPKGAGSVTTHTPFIFRIRKYGFIQFEDSALTYTNAAIISNQRLAEDSVVQASEATAAAYTGIAVVGGGTQTITLTESRPLLEIYEYIKDWEADGALGIDESTVMTSVDGLTFTMSSGWTLVVNSGGNFTGILGGDCLINVDTDLTDVTINGDLDITITADTTLEFDNVTVTGNVTNSAGSNTLTINASNGSSLTAGDAGTGNGQTNIVNAVNITITVNDAAGAAVENAQVAVYQTSDNTQLMNEDTLVSGIATESFNYASDTAIYYRIRKSSTGDTKYLPAAGSGTITNVGFATTVTLLADSIA